MDHNYMTIISHSPKNSMRVLPVLKIILVMKNVLYSIRKNGGLKQHVWNNDFSGME